MQLACWALAPLSNKLLCETGSFSHRGNGHSPHQALSLSFPLSHLLPCSLTLHHSQPCPQGLLPHWFLSICCLTGLVVLFDYFFNSMVVRVPCSLIFWHFWLFTDFRLVIILLLVVQEREVFLPTPPSWPEIGPFLRLWETAFHSCPDTWVRKPDCLCLPYILVTITSIYYLSQFYTSI